MTSRVTARSVETISTVYYKLFAQWASLAKNIRRLTITTIRRCVLEFLDAVENLFSRDATSTGGVVDTLVLPAST